MIIKLVMNMMKEIEAHPWEPFLPEGAKVLMLGSFPPKPERWKMSFYYPNLQNDMWRIFGLIFFHNKDYFLTEDGKSFQESRIRDFLTEKGIAVGDVAKRVIRHKNNASDQFLEVVETLSLNEVLEQLPYCKTIVTTGQKATDTVLELLNVKAPGVGDYSSFVYRERGLRLYRMPSSSRAYPKPLVEKAKVYRKMMEELGLC